jgi:hypothetical protein
MIVRPHPRGGRAVHERHRLRELPGLQYRHRTHQLRHLLVRRLAPHRRAPLPQRLHACLLLEEPARLAGEVPERPQLGQVVEHPDQVVPLRLVQRVGLFDDQEAMLEDKGRLLLEPRTLGRPDGPSGLAGSPPLAFAAGVPPPPQGVSQPAHRSKDQGVDVLEEVEDAELVPGGGPQLVQHGGVQGRAVGDDHPRSQAPGLEVLQEAAQVTGVVPADEGEAHGQVGQRIGGHQQGKAAQVDLIDAQRPGELREDAPAVRRQVELRDLPPQAVVDEALGQGQQEVALQRVKRALDVEAILQESVKDGLPDCVVVGGLGRDREGPGAEVFTTAAAGLVLCIVDVEPRLLAVRQGADSALQPAGPPAGGAAAGAGMRLGGAADDMNNRREHGLCSWGQRG